MAQPAQESNAERQKEMAAVNGTVYLAGKMAGLSLDEMLGWRNEAARKLRDAGFAVLNPVDVFLAEKGDKSPREIVDSNKYQIRHSDIVLAELSHPELSIGTLGELVYAREMGKVVIAWGGAWYTDHPWVREHVTAIYGALDEALECIINKYSKAG